MDLIFGKESLTTANYPLCAQILVTFTIKIGQGVQHVYKKENFVANWLVNQALIEVLIVLTILDVSSWGVLVFFFFFDLIIR